MAVASAIVGASGYTGAELLRLLAGHPELEVVYATADSNAGVAGDDALPVAGGGLRRSRVRRVRPRSRRRARRGLRRASRTGRARSWCPTCSSGWPTSSTSAPTSACPPTRTPSGTARRTAHPSSIDRFGFGMVELFRDQVAARAHVASPGVLPDGVVPRAGAARRRRAGRAHRDRRQRRVGHLGRGTQARGGEPLRRARAERRRLRPPDPSPHRRDRARARPRGRCAGAGPVHAPPGPDDPGDPRHLRRPPRGRRPDHRRASSIATASTTPASRSSS